MSVSYCCFGRLQDRYVDWLRALGVMNNWVNVITYAIADKADALIPGTFTVRA